ncbi:MAG: hypothetical protein DRP66_12055 [Planctomycetota bacterium]|nr:MAG: hypothetical protein DRP66_12055 [Planctomycetota bacterium]
MVGSCRRQAGGAANQELTTTNYQLQTTNYELPTTNYELPTIKPNGSGSSSASWPTSKTLLSAQNRQPAVRSHESPTDHCLQDWNM